MSLLQVHDKQYNIDVMLMDEDIYSPAIPKQDAAHEIDCGKFYISRMQSANDATEVKIKYADKPSETSYERGMWDAIDRFENKAWSPATKGYKTGFKTIDDGFDGGIKPAFIIVAGESNIGKSAFISQLAWNIATLNNDECYVMDFSLDDSLADKLARIVACSGKVYINAAKTPLLYKEYPMMLIRRKQALARIRENTKNYRIYDSTEIGTYIEDIEEEIENKLIYFKSNGIKKQVVVCIDSFHDLNIKSKQSASDKEKFDYLAQWCADIAIKYDIIMLCTGEMKKTNSTKRPMLDDLKESSKIKYEAKAILMVYNELHYKGENASVYFTEPGSTIKKPIFEVRFAKNKLASYKGTEYFEFYPETALMKECNDQQKKHFSSQGT